MNANDIAKAWALGRARAESALRGIRAIGDEIQDHPLPLRQLEARLVEDDAFRVVFVGAFKRGKSTLISALAKHPRLAPSGVLPCTDVITEYAYGTECRYFRAEGIPPYEWHPTTREIFESESKVRHASRKVPSGTDSRPPELRFRVEVPSPVLEPMRLTFVDTPGTSEDARRHVRALRELRNADATVVVLSCQQALSSDEAILLEEIGEQRLEAIIALNHGERYAEHASELRDHIVTTMWEREVRVAPERIVLVSAQREVDALQHGSDGTDSSSIETLRQAILADVTTAAARRFLEVARDRAASLRAALSESVRNAVRGHAAEASSAIEDQIRGLQLAIHAANGAKDEAVREAKAARFTVNALEESLLTVLGKVLDALPAMSARFEPKASSPSEYARELSEWACAQLKSAVEEWCESEDVVNIVERVFAERATEIENALTPLDALCEKLGRPRIDSVRELVENSFRLVVGLPAAEGGLGAGVATAGAVTVSALVAGYVVADGILFGIIGIIGFFNPIILGTAAVLAITGAAIGGPPAVRFEMVRAIARDQRKKMNKVDSELRDGIRKSIEPIHEKLGEVLSGKLEQALELGRQRLQRLEGELGAAKEGDPDALGERYRYAKVLEGRLVGHLDELDAALASMLPAEGERAS